MGSEEHFPRDLNAVERALILWVLPADRKGYADCRKLVDEWKVLGRGRRGDGNYILAKAGHEIDLDSPLPQLLAHGCVEGDLGEVSISVREPSEDQLEFEISGQADDSLLRGFEERKRWTFSDWLPVRPCPSCGGTIREISLKTLSDQMLTLALCVRDQRLWVYNNRSGINHPIPVTSFYNELMLQKKVHDPKIALDAKRLFSDLSTYTDAALSRAFSSYNQLRRRVVLEEPLVIETERHLGWFERVIQRLFKRGR